MPRLRRVSELAVELDGQYRALREEAGAARRERGIVVVSGQDAAEYLQGQLTNDIEALEPGQGAYSALLDRKGKMQADMRVLRTADDVRIGVEPEALAKTLRHLTMYAIGRDVSVEDHTGELALISVAGPASSELTGLPPLRSENDHAAAELDGIEVTVIRTDLGLDLVTAADGRGRGDDGAGEARRCTGLRRRARDHPRRGRAGPASAGR